MKNSKDNYKKDLEEIDKRIDSIDDKLIDSMSEEGLIKIIKEQRNKIRELNSKNTKLETLKIELRNRLNNYGTRSIGTSMSGKDYNCPKEITVTEVLNIIDELEGFINE